MMKPWFACLWLLLLVDSHLAAQSLGAGTLKGTVVDASGAALPSASVELSNAITGFSREVRTAADGSFVIEDIPRNTYTVHTRRQGFQLSTQTVAVRTTVPLDIRIELMLAGQQTTVTVEAHFDELVENLEPPSHSVDQRTIAALPVLSPGSGLNDAITFTTPTVAPDSNGFFHPLGDHAPRRFVIDA